MNNRKYLIVVTGPTAIGKTALAIALAKHYTTVIISADSRQCYREMRIGTAVPDDSELAEVPHHFMQHRSVAEPYSTGDFEREAITKLHALFKKHDIVIMAGGSGLYIDAILKGLDDFPEVDPEIREQLNTRLRKEGIEALQEQLRKADPGYFKQADIHNPRRLIRALEICIATGKPYSSFLGEKKVSREFIPLLIGITADRETVYDRINRRVERMMKQGFLEEAQQLYPHRNENALQTVGYKELFHYLEGKYSLKEAVSEIKKNTRRYAKRQLTWLRGKENLIRVQLPVKIEAVIREIDQHIRKG